MSTFKRRVAQEFNDIKILLRNIPSITVTVFILSVVCANLMANKELLNVGYVALDCGFAFSWIMFLCMDVICKRYGPKASIEVSIIALLANLTVCGLFFLLSLTPGKWGEFYSFELNEVNSALNNTFGGAWYVVLGSGLAFLTSSVVNAILNYSLGKNLKKNNFIAFAFRSYTSTIIAQFVDNFIFATVVSKIFFGWTWTQVVVCSIIGAVCELLGEILFSGFGWKVVKNWDEENVGNEYFNYIEKKRA
ncbi:VUT family protein [Treponema sp.]|uniref:VUT family protein n=1 Tax=Treponema sp. TaxID=166 RepID=UPI0025D25CFA|nr:VUT family protein [Treponema sp.]MCR5218712.1 VUT family protein [Treponema sp.]